MKAFFLKLKAYVLEHKKQIGSIAAAVLGVVVVGLIVALFIYTTQSKIKYEPIVACDLLTLDEAKSMLGEETINSINNKPQLDDDLAVSRCGYTDAKWDNMKVAAVIVRSGINDDGVAQNKEQFMDGKPDVGIQEIEGLGDAAYFNEANRQLNILKDRYWAIVTYGVGEDPLNNDKEETIELGRKVVN